MTKVKTKNNLYTCDDSLEVLLHTVDNLFGIDPLAQPELSVPVYSLSRLPYGWKFNVIDSWQKWNDNHLQHSFGTYRDPKYCVMEFLDYVFIKRIDVKELMS